MSRRRASCPAIACGCLAATLVFVSPPNARADVDYAPANEGWNGLSGLVSDARTRGVELASPTELDLSTVGPTDGLLIVHPVRPLPAADLAAFVQGGGRLVVADDFGSAEPLLARFSIARHPLVESSAPRVRGHEGLWVARTHFRHPLTEGVDLVVTNHPAAVRHPNLAPLVAFERDGEGVLLTGVVGRGRLVVLSDPSVLINEMRAFKGNERLARNLLDVLSGPSHGRVYLVTSETRLVGEYDGAAGKPFRQRFEDLLERLAELELPPGAVRVVDAMLAALLLLFAFSASSQKSPYRFPFGSPREDSPEARRSRLESRRVTALLSLHDELSTALAAHLSLPRELLLEEAPRALVARGWSRVDVDGALTWLGDVASVDTAWHAGMRTRMSERRLASLVKAGEGLLSRLEKGTPHA